MACSPHFIQTLDKITASNRPRWLFIKIAFAFIVLVILATPIRSMYFHYAPHTRFFLYHDVRAVALVDEFPAIGDQYLVMESVREIKRAGVFRYRDDLECMTGDSSWRTIARSASTGPARIGSNVVQWEFPVGTLFTSGRITTPTICRMESLVEMELPYGAITRQFVLGSEFEIPIP